MVSFKMLHPSGHNELLFHRFAASVHQFLTLGLKQKSQACSHTHSGPLATAFAIAFAAGPCRSFCSPFFGRIDEEWRLRGNTKGQVETG